MATYITKNCWISYETCYGNTTTFSVRCNKSERRPFQNICLPFIKKYIKPERGDRVSYSVLSSGEKVAMFHIGKTVNIDEIKLRV